jgi:hypothetical protein
LGLSIIGKLSLFFNELFLSACKIFFFYVFWILKANA